MAFMTVHNRNAEEARNIGGFDISRTLWTMFLLRVV